MIEKRKKIGFLERDTIFSGNFSKEAKVHTLENICRVIGGLCLFFAGQKNIWWLSVIGFPLIGFVFRLTPDEKHLDLKIW